MEPLEWVQYTLSKPFPMFYKDDATLIVDQMFIRYHRQEQKPRKWEIIALVDRFYLLPLSQSKLFTSVTPQKIIGFSILKPVQLILKPRDDLEKDLNQIEDEHPVVHPKTGVIDGQLSIKMKNLRNFEFVDMKQESQFQSLSR